MLKLTQDGYGGPEVLRVESAEDPVPGPGEALIGIEAIGVNPADWKRRAGLLTHFAPPPFTLGLDFAGRVQATGEGAEVATGEAVFGFVLPPAGSYATHVVAPLESVSEAPPQLSVVEAAGLPLAGLTAWQSVIRVAEVKPGQRVLVHAASGGVGHLAVQIAKDRGARVIGTGRSANHDFLRELGCDEVVDYRDPGFERSVGKVDVVIDPLSGENALRSLEMLDEGGLLVDVRGTGPDREEIERRAEAVGVRYVRFGVSPRAEDLRELAALVNAGKLRPRVEKVYASHEVGDAHELSETGHVRGKLVLLPPTAEEDGAGD